MTTRERMYIETMQQIFSSTSKVLVDARSGGNMLFLPLDKIMQMTAAGALPELGPAARAASTEVAPPAESTPSATSTPRSRDALRGREREAR